MRSRSAWVSATVYLLGSVALFHSVVLHPRSTAPQGGTGDVAQMAWFLESTAQALVHGRDPLVSQAIHAPWGVNLMWNTAVPLLGLLTAPLTLLGGPLLAVNALFVAAPVLTALTTRWWLLRHSSALGAAIGGAALGFGPYVAAHLGGHLNLVFLPLVPVILRLGEDVVVRRPGDRRCQVGLGVAVAAQLLVSEEVLLLTLLGGAAALLVLRVRPTRGLLTAAVTAGVLTAVPVLVQLLGPQRARGVNPYRYYAAPRDVVVPNDHLLLGLPGETARLVARGSSAFEDAVYLGVPALVLAVVAAVRVPATRRPLAVAALALLLTTGKGEHRGWAGLRHPLSLLLSPPVLSSVVATRFALVTGVVLAWLLAVLAGRNRAWLLAAVLVVITWLPAPPNQSAVRVPSFFTQAHLRLQGPVLLLPAPPEGAERAMLYQAMCGLCFTMTDSYALELGLHGEPRSHAPEDPVTWLSHRPLTAANVDAARQRPLAPTVVLVAQDDPGARLRRAAEALLGPPSVEGGVLLWRRSGSTGTSTRAR